jgi:hypothetical protein
MKSRRAKIAFVVASIVAFDGLFLLLRELGAGMELKVVALALVGSAIGLSLGAFWELPPEPPWWVRARRRLHRP